MTQRRETQIELLNQAFSGTYATSLLSTVAGVLFCSILWDSLPAVQLIGWFSFLLIAQVIRIGCGVLHKKMDPTEDYEQCKRLLMFSTIPASLLWGVFPLISFPYIDDISKSIITIFIAAAPTAQLLTIGSIFRVWLVSTIILIYPACIMWMFHGTTGILLGVGGIIFSGYLYGVARRYSSLMGDRLELSYKADAASQAKTKFLATASHDLRQPLHAITMALAATQNLINREDPTSRDLDNARKTLNTVETSVDGLSRLLNALMDVSKLESGGVKPKFSNIPVSNILENLRATYETRAKEKHLEFRILPCGLTIHSDPVYLQRIVSNLVSNAVRHVQEGRILIGCKRNGDSLRIKVYDTGPGIPTEKFNEIFQEFSQLENEGRLNSSGQGLGLSIADRLSHVLNHRLFVESTPGKGSVFSVEVPISKFVDLPDAQSLTTTPKIQRRQLVVLIDPNTVALEETAVQLRQWGYRVLAFTSCEEAQHLQIRPSLIIAQQSLPNKISGFEAVNILRGSWKTDAAALVMISELDHQVIKEAGNNHCDVISSPPNPSEFKNTLLDLIEGR